MFKKCPLILAYSSDTCDYACAMLALSQTRACALAHNYLIPGYATDFDECRSGWKLIQKRRKLGLVAMQQKRTHGFGKKKRKKMATGGSSRIRTSITARKKKEKFVHVNIIAYGWRIGKFNAWFKFDARWCQLLILNSDDLSYTSMYCKYYKNFIACLILITVVSYLDFQLRSLNHLDWMFGYWLTDISRASMESTRLHIGETSILVSGDVLLRHPKFMCLGWHCGTR